MTDQTKREIKLVSDLQPGDVVVEPEQGQDGEPHDAYRTVRIAEPIGDSPGRYLVVFAGAETHNVRSTEDYALATRAEIAAHEQLVRDAEKRARMRLGLMKLIDALDDGLPLPDHFQIDAACMASHDAVRQAAAVLGADASERDNGGRPLTEVKVDFVPARDYGVPEVHIRMWHLGDRAEES